MTGVMRAPRPLFLEAGPVPDGSIGLNVLCRSIPVPMASRIWRPCHKGGGGRDPMMKKPKDKGFFRRVVWHPVCFMDAWFQALINQRRVP